MDGTWDGVEKKGSGMFGGLFKQVGKLALAAGAVVTTAFGASKVFGGGMARLMGIEEAQAKMRGLGHDADTVETIMGNALASVRGTSFGMAEAATTAAGAVAAGIKPGEDLERVLKSVANSAAASGSSMDEMGAIYNNVASVGKAQNDVLRQVAQRGIPIYQALADQLGVTTEEVFKMASAGKIGFAEFEEAMTAASGTVAAEMGGTLRGSIENMNAALGRIGANFLEGVYPKLAPAIQSITGWLGGVEEAAKGAGERLGDALDGGIEAWQAFSRGINAEMIAGDLDNTFAVIGQAVRWRFVLPLQDAGEAWGEFWRGLTAQMTTGDVESRWASFGRAVRHWAGDIGTAFADAGGGLDGFLAAVQTSIESGAAWIERGGATVVVDALMSMRHSLTDAAMTLFGAIAEALPRILPEIVSVLTGTVLPAIVSTFAVLIPELVGVINDLLPPLILALAGVVEGLALAVATGLPDIVAALAELLPLLVATLASMLPTLIEAAVTLFLGLAEGLSVALPSIIQAISDSIPLIITAITDALPLLIDGAILLFLGILDGLIIALPDIIAAVVAAVPQIVEALIEAIPLLIEGAITLFHGIITGIEEAMPDIAAAAAGLVPVIVDALLSLDGSLRGAGTGMISSIGMGMLSEIPSIHTLTARFGDELVRQLRSYIPQMLESGKRWIIELLDGMGIEWPKVTAWLGRVGAWVVQAIGNAREWLRGKGVDAITGFLTGVTLEWPKLRQWFRDLPTRIVEALGNVGNRLVSSGRSLINGFTQGIRDAFSNAKAAVRNGLSDLRRYFPFSPAKEGPFSGRGYTIHSGRALMRDFAAGAQSEVQAARRALESAMRDLQVTAPSLAVPALETGGLAVTPAGIVFNIDRVINPIEEPLTVTANRKLQQAASLTGGLVE